MRCTTAFLLSLAIATGCGEDSTPSSPDATVSSTPADAAVTGTSTAYALGTDNAAAGVLTRIGVPSATVSSNFVAAVATNDAVVRAHGGKLYIVNRFGHDNVTIVDIATGSLVAQISTGAGSNPQDVAVVGDHIYVCAYNVGSIIVLHEDEPSATPETIDISSYDADGLPNCNSIIASGGKVYATLGLLDENFVSTGGKVVVIDPDDHSIETDFDLTYKNPFGSFIATDPDGGFGGDLLVPTTEDFGSGPGCIERISTGDTPGSNGCLITNGNLGGFATRLGTRGDQLWVAVSTSFTTAKLIQVSSGGILDERSLTADDHHVTDFAVCPTGQILATDNATGSVVLFHADGADKTPKLDIGLPPAYANGLVCL